MVMTPGLLLCGAGRIVAPPRRGGQCRNSSIRASSLDNRGVPAALADQRAVLPRRRPGPLAERLVEGAGVGKAQPEGQLGEVRLAAVEMGDGQVAAQLVLERLVGLARLGRMTAQGRGAHVEVPRQ